MKIRCPWCLSDPLYMDYHDHEWGVPVHDDRTWFEFLLLEGVQAGLSWHLILKKRQNYRRAYDGFDFATVAGYDEKRIARLLADPGLIRNRLKIAASVSNARAFNAIREEFGSFDKYVWPFVGSRPVLNRWETTGQLPAKTGLSDALSRDLVRRGFKFVGSTIIYSLMQATGMVNDHLVDCFRYNEINRKNKKC
jgi:DNA-3-methyladenine glycosylase I